MTAPIALFVYNRPAHTQQTVEALQRNLLADQSDLFIYSDAAKTSKDESAVQEVRAYIRGILGFKSLTISEKNVNWGVDASIVDGVTTLCEQSGKVIVLEDDIVTSSWFLSYMNRALDLYQNENSVMQISGFMYPLAKFNEQKACFLTSTSAWGWATWARAWNHFDPSASGFEILNKSRSARHTFDMNSAYDYFEMLTRVKQGKLDAWDIRWYLSVFIRSGLVLFPQKSLVHNIGFDGSGVHCLPSDFAGSEISDKEVTVFPAVKSNPTVMKAVESYLRARANYGLKQSAKRALKRTLHHFFRDETWRIHHSILIFAFAAMFGQGDYVHESSRLELTNDVSFKGIA